MSVVMSALMNRVVAPPALVPRPTGGSGGSSRAATGAALRRFGRCEHGGVAIESAIALFVLVVGFAGLMSIVDAALTSDRMGRAARAAAHALALHPNNDWCAAIRRELRLDEDFDCDAAWNVTVAHGVGPAALPATLDANAPEGTGDMVLVRIEWSPPLVVPAGSRAGRERGRAGNSPAPRPATRVAMGLYRCEPVDAG